MSVDLEQPVYGSRAETRASTSASQGLEGRVETREQSLDREAVYRTHRRFDRAARLFTEPGLARLMDARVIIFGMGGVGSFTAEALSRSAVGELVLVDFDDVCVTNTNRQLHALKGNVGKHKVEVMAE